jgi:hypothetical protein
MTSVAALPAGMTVPTLAPSSVGTGAFDMDAFTSAFAIGLGLLGASGAFPPPPPALGLAHSVSVDGTGLYPSPLQIPAFVDVPASAEAPGGPMEMPPQITALEQAWLALNEKLATQIADSEESRAHAHMLLRDVIESAYDADHLLHAAHQDRWMVHLDALRETVRQWADMGEMHALIQGVETAYINLVAFLDSQENPDDYYPQYSTRAWAVLA